jgi:hypothetical protein
MRPRLVSRGVRGEIVWNKVRMLDYAGERDRLLAAFADRERRKVHGGGKKTPTEKALAAARNKAFGTTLPLRLVDALMLEHERLSAFRMEPPAGQP